MAAWARWRGATDPLRLLVVIALWLLLGVFVLYPLAELLRRAFVDEGAVQCGFCTPGLVMAVHDLLDRCAHPSDLDVREAISGNLCRCTGYGRIFAAVRRAEEALSGDCPDDRSVEVRGREGQHG